MRPALLIAAGLLCGSLLSAASGARAATPTWEQQVDAVFRMQGQDKPEGVHRIDIIRENMLL